MSGLFDSNKTDSNDRGVVVIGDSTIDRNANVTADNRLMVDAVVSGVTTIPTWKNTLVYEDMITNSRVARDTIISTTWVDVYSYSGAGRLSGFTITLETSETDWQLRLVVDGNEILGGANGLFTEELEKSDRYGFDADTARNLCTDLGINFRGDSIRFTFPHFPVGFSSSVVIKIKRVTGAATKKFKSGLVLIQKGV